MEPLHQRLGPHAMGRDLVDLGVEYTLQYDPYEDESKNAKTFPILDEEPEVPQEWRHQYLNTETLPPERGQNGQSLRGTLEGKCQWYSNW